MTTSISKPGRGRLRWSRLRELVAGQRIGWALGPGLLLAGCHAASPAADCLLLDVDFEQYANQPPTPSSFLTDEKAHSGQYCCRLPEKTEYGAVYQALLGHCGEMPRRLRLSAWVYVPSGRIGATKLVVKVVCHGRRPDVRKNLALDEVVKRYQKWEPVQKYIRLPADLNPSDELKVYLWHPEYGGESIWLDDIKVAGGQ